MNFSLYVLGNPRMYDQFPLDYSELFSKYAYANKYVSTVVVHRQNSIIQYVFIKKVQDDSDLFFGFALMVSDMYCVDHQELHRFFENAFDNVLAQGTFISFKKDKYIYNLSRFIEDNSEIERINEYFRSKDKELERIFRILPSNYQVGLGECEMSIEDDAVKFKTLSLKYDTLYVPNKERSLTEMDRMQKKWADLYLEHLELNEQYKKVLNQKRNFKLVSFLAIIIVGCAIAFFVLKNILNDREGQIGGLQGVLSNKEQTIKSNESHIDSLQNKVKSLQSDISTKQTKIDYLESENQSLEGKVDELQRNVNLLKDQLPKRYRIWAYSSNKATCYCKTGNGNYEATQSYYWDDTYIDVYKMENGYALTEHGVFVRTRDIQRVY